MVQDLPTSPGIDWADLGCRNNWCVCQSSPIEPQPRAYKRAANGRLESLTRFSWRCHCKDPWSGASHDHPERDQSSCSRNLFPHTCVTCARDPNQLGCFFSGVLKFYSQNWALGSKCSPGSPFLHALSTIARGQGSSPSQDGRNRLNCSSFPFAFVQEKKTCSLPIKRGMRFTVFTTLHFLLWIVRFFSPPTTMGTWCTDVALEWKSTCLSPLNAYFVIPLNNNICSRTVSIWLYKKKGPQFGGSQCFSGAAAHCTWTIWLS